MTASGHFIPEIRLEKDSGYVHLSGPVYDPGQLLWRRNGVGTRSVNRDLFEPIAPGQITECGVSAVEKDAPAAGFEDVPVVSVQGTEFFLKRRCVPLISGRVRRVDFGQSRPDLIDKHSVDLEIEPDMRVKAFLFVMGFRGVLRHQRDAQDAFDRFQTRPGGAF